MFYFLPIFIMDIITNYEANLWNTCSGNKWLIVKEQLHYMRRFERQDNSGLTPAEIEFRRRQCMEYLKAAKMGSLEYVDMYASNISIDRDFKDELVGLLLSCRWEW